MIEMKREEKNNAEKTHMQMVVISFVCDSHSPLCLFGLSISLRRPKQCEWSNELSRGQWKALLQSLAHSLTLAACVYRRVSCGMCIVRECEYDVWIWNSNTNIAFHNFYQSVSRLFLSLHCGLCATVAAIYSHTEQQKPSNTLSVQFSFRFLFFALSSVLYNWYAKRKHCTNLQHIE